MANKGLPRRGDLVIATVTKMNPYSVIVKLDEYDKEGMIHISEVSRKWVQNIKKVIKMGQTIVAVVVNVTDGSISLSLKRVNKYESEEKLKQFKREKKAEKLLKLVAKRLGLKYDDIYATLGAKLREKFGELFTAFHTASTPEGRAELIKNGFSEKEVDAVCVVSKDAMETKELKMKKIIELKCYKSNGVEIIKRVLTDVEKKYKVEIKYVSAPEYSLAVETKNAKAGEKKLMEAVNEIKNEIASRGECILKGE